MKRVALALLLVGLGRLASPSAVPVFDGVGAPDEPYRYVGRANPPAASVSVSAAVTATASGSLQLKTAESGPQLLVDLAAGAFSSSTAAVTLSAAPLTGDGATVPQGSIDGNVYRITVTPGARLAPQQAQGFLFLRAAVMTRPDPVIVHRTAPADRWVTVQSVRAGRDILTTPFVALGDYAVVRLPGASDLSSAGSLGTTRVLLLVGGVLLLLMITVVVLRRRPS